MAWKCEQAVTRSSCPPRCRIRVPTGWAFVTLSRNECAMRAALCNGTVSMEGADMLEKDMLMMYNRQVSRWWNDRKWNP